MNHYLNLMMPTNFPNPIEDIPPEVNVVTRIYYTSIYIWCNQYIVSYILICGIFGIFAAMGSSTAYQRVGEKETVETKRLVYPCPIIGKCMCLSIEMDSEIYML